MYYASFSPDKQVRDAAVRYGIGRHRGSDAGEIYKRLIQLAINGENVETVIHLYRTERQAWKDLMMKYLQSYLDSPNVKVREQAVFIKDDFTK